MQPIFYPDAHLETELLPPVALYFQNIWLFQPGGMDPHPDLDPYVKEGVIRLPRTRRPAPRNLAQALEEYLAWARDHFGNMQQLQAESLSAQWKTQESRQFIIRHLKGLYRDQQLESVPDQDWQAYLILNLARKVDEEHRKVQDLLEKVESAENSLGHLVGLEEPSEFVLPQKTSAPSPIQGDYLIRERIVAWIRLFGEQLPLDGVPVTGNPYVHESMLEKCSALLHQGARKRPSGLEDQRQGILSVGPLTLPVPRGYPPERLLQIRNGWARALRLSLQQMMVDFTSPPRELALGQLKDRLSSALQEMEERARAARESLPVPKARRGEVAFSFTLACGLSLEKVLARTSNPPDSSEASTRDGDPRTLFVVIETT